MYTANFNNLILNADSYKASHWLQYPPGSEYMSSYVEARKGDYDVVFFGLQAYIKEYLSKPITTEDINEAEKVIKAHGLPFNRSGWERIVEKHGGYLPVRIQAVPEGSIIPVSNVVCQIVNTDPDFYWLPSYLETSLLRAIWYPSSVASLSFFCKTIINEALQKSADSNAGLAFKLHDFGARGASSFESVALGSLAHLVNFSGTDSMTALVSASRWYGMTDDMPAFSIPAAEHSTMTSWGREQESQAYANMLDQFGGEGKLVAVVSDSYDLWNAIDHIWGEELKEQVETMGGTLVIRPDSGDPAKVVREALERLSVKFGYSVNSKGYKLLPEYVRLIQGDGISPLSLSKILDTIMQAGFSADNVTFGMGGGLLQQVTRDTMSWAMKASAIQIDGTWKEIFKDPITSRSKRSKKGRLALVKDDNGHISTIKEDSLKDGTMNLLRDVFVDGELLVDENLTTIRQRTGSW
ncbi:nicotinate phosphoribosyltransferase [Psychrobacter sp.]|uniref:nicotinate phosphoribosyltransferase n=1 Tax=Psychrobacter sp. TaxID=56811 RepID=UPI0025DEDC7D|nr:nicotinate phosphoribosyltransferase [Psychrobacter sp.]